MAIKSQKEEYQAQQDGLKDGTISKTQIDTISLIGGGADPGMLETKANLKDQFSKLTQKRQPYPEPGSYEIPSTFKAGHKPWEHQNFGSTKARF